MKRFIFSIICFFFILFATEGFAQFYQWVDKNGIKHFTDNLLEVPKDQRSNLQIHKTIKSPEIKDTTPKEKKAESGINNKALRTSLESEKAELDKEYKAIQKKRENLDDVIKYEDIAIENDSILRIANMTASQQLEYFTAYTVALKQQAVQDSIALVEEQQNIENQEFFKSNNPNAEAKGGPKGGGTFYLYNMSTVSRGKQEFSKRWGKRTIEDNRRLSSK
ncbi:MAG: DUF4124 domain-containing protein, partial [Desulfobacula sp.]|nr:DUF4124 domain-containing protein [Desulfobacula sp.]